jgi:hypothetical protein
MSDPEASDCRDNADSPELEKLQQLRRLARRIDRHPWPDPQKGLLALMQLLDWGLNDGGLPREWVRLVIWEEGQGLLSGRPGPRDEPVLRGDAVEQALRRLLARGLISCPTCHRPVPSEDTLDRWRDTRLADLARARQREEAGH